VGFLNWLTKTYYFSVLQGTFESLSSAKIPTPHHFPKESGKLKEEGQPMIAIFPKIAECIFDKDVEKLVCMVRSYYGEDQVHSPKLDVLALCTQIGLRIHFLDLEYPGAIVCVDERGGFDSKIFLSRKAMRGQDQNFTLAHLLGHFFLHIQPGIIKGELGRKGFKEFVQPMERYLASRYESDVEEEADQFAAALLMPLGMVNRAGEQVSDRGRIADIFGLPKAVIERRLQLIHGPEQRLSIRAVVKAADPVAPKMTTQAPRPAPSEGVSSEGPNFLDLYRQIQETKASPVSKGQPSGSTGMAKIREIARRLDPSLK
jgi:hypothetical protein